MRKNGCPPKTVQKNRKASCTQRASEQSTLCSVSPKNFVVVFHQSVLRACMRLLGTASLPCMRANACMRLPCTHRHAANLPRTQLQMLPCMLQCFWLIIHSFLQQGALVRWLQVRRLLVAPARYCSVILPILQEQARTFSTNSRRSPVCYRLRARPTVSASAEGRIDTAISR